jgi:osmotically-inducible protein OsmY
MLTHVMHKKLCGFLVMLLLGVADCVGAAASDAELTRNIQRQLSSLDYGSRRPVVAVADGVVTISGTVTSLWLKEETINHALKVPGISSLVADLIIARAESDQVLAVAVADRIQHYARLSVFDDIQGSVRNGTVRLSGAITEDKKLADIVERVAKVKGVQAIDNKVIVLPASSSDDGLRVAIADAIYGLAEFERYSMANPPIHVIVNNGHVTLIGVVRSELERRKAHEAARFVFGVLALDDRVKLAKDVK